MELQPAYTAYRFGTKAFAIQEAQVIGGSVDNIAALPAAWRTGNTLYIPGGIFSTGLAAPASAKSAEPVKLIERIGTGVKGATYAGGVFTVGHLANSTADAKLYSLLSDNGVLNLAPEHAQSAAEAIKTIAASRTGKAIVVGISAGVLVIGVLEAISPTMVLRKRIAIAVGIIAAAIAGYFLLSHMGIIVP